MRQPIVRRERLIRELMKPESKSPETRYVHSGETIDTTYGALTPPIYRATTYHQGNPWDPPPYDYARSGNPTRQALEDALAHLEFGTRGFAFASGMAALTAAFLLFASNDHLLVTRDCQGGTQRVLRGVFQRFGLEVSYVDTEDLDQLTRHLRPNTRGLLVENFSNPFLGVTDIELVAKWAHDHNLLVMVDNTFITPYLQNPLTLGADVVIHSATKMISGHSDVTAGVAVVADSDLQKRLYFIQNACGIALSPEESYEALKGLRTLPIRMEKAQATAIVLAQELASLPQVGPVYYPGLPTHPGYQVARRTTRGFGQMLTFRVHDAALVPDFVQSLQLAKVGAGFGGTETIISLPELHCHAALTQEERDDRHITSDVVRVSVGLEGTDDLIADFRQALDHASKSV